MRLIPFALLTLAACVPEPVRAPPRPALGVGDILAQQADAPPPAKLTLAQAQRDLDVLRFVLERAYVGSLPEVGVIQRDLWQSLDALRALPPLVPLQLCLAVDRILARVPDGHLGTHIPCTRETEKPWAQVGKNLATGKVWTYEEREGTAILAISTFMNGQMSPWKGFDAAVESATHAKGIVVDLRGNGGGDPSRGYALAARLLDSTPENAAGETRRIERTTPEAWALAMDTMVGMLGDQRFTDERKAAFALELDRDHTRLRNSLAGGAERTITETAVGPAVGASPYPGEVSVLVDEYCFSACETVSFALLQHPRARLVGHTTAGAGRFSNVMWLKLANSGIRIGIAAVVIQYAEGRVFPERKGLVPSVVVPAGQDALEVTVRSRE